MGVEFVSGALSIWECLLSTVRENPGLIPNPRIVEYRGFNIYSSAIPAVSVEQRVRLYVYGMQETDRILRIW